MDIKLVDSVPEWAGWLAQDSDGYWYVHDREPHVANHISWVGYTKVACVYYSDPAGWDTSLVQLN